MITWRIFPRRQRQAEVAQGDGILTGHLRSNKTISIDRQIWVWGNQTKDLAPGVQPHQWLGPRHPSNSMASPRTSQTSARHYLVRDLNSSPSSWGVRPLPTALPRGSNYDHVIHPTPNVEASSGSESQQRPWHEPVRVSGLTPTYWHTSRVIHSPPCSSHWYTARSSTSSCAQ